MYTTQVCERLSGCAQTRPLPHWCIHDLHPCRCELSNQRGQRSVKISDASSVPREIQYGSHERGGVWHGAFNRQTDLPNDLVFVLFCGFGTCGLSPARPRLPPTAHPLLVARLPAPHPVCPRRRGGACTHLLGYIDRDGAHVEFLKV